MTRAKSLVQTARCDFREETSGNKSGYMLGHPCILSLLMWDNEYMSKNAKDADNQQERLSIERILRDYTPDPRRVNRRGEDIVRASWRHGEQHEQGIRRGTCGWNISLKVHFVNFGRLCCNKNYCSIRCWSRSLKFRLVWDNRKELVDEEIKRPNQS